jgi:peptide/nickel transport system permease protein
VRGAAAKIGQYALVVWVAATVNFALPHLAPGDPVTYFYVGPLQGLSEVQTAQIRASYGLDRSVPEQYAAFWAGLLRGDLGISVQHNRPVTEVLLDRLPWTVVLVGLGILVAAMLGILLAAWAARLAGRPRHRRRRAGAGLDARLLDRHDPTLAFAMLGEFFLLARGSMVAALDEPFVRLARAKGLTERRVALHHVLRTALLPVYTNVTLALGALLSGAVVVEAVFAYPGLGQLIHEAVTARDYPVLQGVLLIVTVGVVAANLLADLTYPLLDPRVRRVVTT